MKKYQTATTEQKAGQVDANGKPLSPNPPDDSGKWQLIGLHAFMRHTPSRITSESDRLAYSLRLLNDNADRLAIGNVASRATPGFCAVVSLLATQPWDEVTGAPKVRGEYPFIAESNQPWEPRRSWEQWLRLDDLATKGPRR